MKVISAVILLALTSTKPCRGQVSTRIIGGDPVGNDRFPYYALLQGVYVQNGRTYVETCGGTLITSQIVLVRNMDLQNTKSHIVPGLAYRFLDFVLRYRRRPIASKIL